MFEQAAKLHQLPPGQVESLRVRPGMWLHVVRGQLWLTESGQPEDVVLGAGDVWRVGTGHTVVQTLGWQAAQYQLRSGLAAPIHPGRRWPLGRVSGPAHS